MTRIFQFHFPTKVRETCHFEVRSLCRDARKATVEGVLSSSLSSCSSVEVLGLEGQVSPCTTRLRSWYPMAGPQSLCSFQSRCPADEWVHLPQRLRVLASSATTLYLSSSCQEVAGGIPGSIPVVSHLGILEYPIMMIYLTMMQPS